LGTKKDFTKCSILTIAISKFGLYTTNNNSFFDTTDSQGESIPFLVYASDLDSDTDEIGERRIEGESSTMASKTVETKTTAIETYERPLGESYRKSSDGLEGNGDESGSIEMVRNEYEGVRGVNGENVDGVVLEHAIEVLEGKKKAWYAYLTTKDFWMVLVLGYVHLPFLLQSIFDD
jgi:hypothetical protein